jgi:LysM repeat protein
MKKIILIISVFLIAGCETVPTYTGPVLPTQAQSTVGTRHRVESGQTLWRISKMYDVDIDDILRVNRLPEEATIEIGQVLLIPSRTRQQNFAAKSSRGEDFIWPVKGKVIAGFGTNYHNLINEGLNIQAMPGGNVLATRSGRVVFYADHFGNFGKTVIIDHGDGLRSIYSRISEALVSVGDSIEKGAIIGRVGCGPRDKNVYLHFEIRKGALAQNPLFYLL